ncbi:MAG: undecaprenyl-diphosphate phosphatase [Polyangiaceae bacterium]
MPLANLVLHSAVQAFAEALGVSGAAHGMALGLWLTTPDRAVFAGSVGLGSGVAVVLAMRGRLFPAIAEGARAIGRPSAFFVPGRAREALVIAWIAIVSAVTGAALRSAGARPTEGPRAIAIGLGITGIAVLAGALVSSSATARHDPKAHAARFVAPRSERAVHESPSWIAASLAGAAHAFGIFPGVSRVGLAAAVLLCLGVKPARAIEVVLCATVPFFWAEAARSLSSSGDAGKGQVLVIALFAFFGAYAATFALRRLTARRALAALSLWMIPLSCAIFAYGRALPGG